MRGIHMLNAPLTRALEEQPLLLDHLVFKYLHRYLSLLVIFLDEVVQDSTRLPVPSLIISTHVMSRHEMRDVPEGEIIVVVVDYRRNSSVGIQLCVGGGFVLACAEIEEDRLKRQAKLLQHNLDFPVDKVYFLSWRSLHYLHGEDIPSIGTDGVGIQGELFSVRHGVLGIQAAYVSV